MKFRPIIIVPGDPFSIFIEIFFKSLSKEYRSPIILIYCKRDLVLQMKKFGFKKKINLINQKDLSKNLDNKKINLIDIKFNRSKNQKIRSIYIGKCLQAAFKLIKNGYTHKFINGPIDKKKILNRIPLKIYFFQLKKRIFSRIPFKIYFLNSKGRIF